MGSSAKVNQAMLNAFRMAQEQLDNYKQVEKEWKMEKAVKRGRGNPNWVKKNTDVVSQVEAPKTESKDVANPEKEAPSLYEGATWLQLYCAVIGTYNSTGPATMKAAASAADLALEEFKKRYGL